MFWELYRNSREQDMRELSQLLSAFFSYAAAQSGTSLDEDTLLQAFPKSAPWLLEQFHGTEKNREKLHKAVEDLFRLPADRRREIARAVDHDMKFDQTASPHRFFFAVPSLPASDQEIVKVFFHYFYDVAFHRALGPDINGHVSGATRDQFLTDYYLANKHLRQVCPVCLHQRSSAARETDLDHYFPKGVYAPLILHPSNLFFACKECNETYKKAEDVLRKGAEPLSKVFLPYQDTVKDHTRVTFRRNANEDQIRLLSASGNPAEQEKIGNFDDLYKLEKRWSADIEGIFKQLRTFCMYRGPGEKKPSKKDVRKKLQRKCEELQALSEFPDRFVESAYLHWLCETMFDAFYDSLWGDDSPQVEGIRN